jgi:CubicO group peptidase (beta-lactamase class C family)
MNRYFSIYICIVGLVIESTVFAQTTATAPNKPADALPAISVAKQKFVDAGDISGAVTLVGRNGKVIHHAAVGLADIQSNRPMKPGSLFSIASMTKPVVATAIMILQDEGKLNIEDNVSKYIPEFASVKLQNGDAANREITIHDLLTHTSGLAGDQIFDGTLAEAATGLAQRPLAFQPGTKWQYSPGLNVAGRIVELVSEKPLEDFLAEKIFEPLAMKNTTFFPEKKQVRRIATLYDHDDNRTLVPTENFIVDFKQVKAPNPSGGLVSNARDMFRFYRMVLNKGKFRGKRIVSAKAVRQMTSPRTGDLKTGFTPGNCWGLGWCIVREPQGVTSMFSAGTFGHGGAFGTQGWVDPTTKSIYVLMIQRSGLPNSDASDMRKQFQALAVPTG